MLSSRLLVQLGFISALTAGSAWSACTQITDTLKLPNLTLYSGQLTIAWGSIPWIAADGTVMPSGPPIAVTIKNGALSVCLEPDLAYTSTVPNNITYQVTYRPAGASAINEIWAVPVSGSPVNLATVRIPAPAPSPTATFISSINGLTASAMFLAAGSNITLTPSGGNTITISSSGGGGGGSVFTGSTGSTVSSGGTPTFSLADVSVKSPILFNFSPSVAVTAPTITNKSAGAEFSIRITPTSTFTWNSIVADGICNPYTDAAGITTTARLLIDPDGSTVHGVGCQMGISGLVAYGAAVSPSSTTPVTSGNQIALLTTRGIDVLGSDGIHRATVKNVTGVRYGNGTSDDSTMSLTTTGSGAASLSGSVLNIPTPSASGVVQLTQVTVSSAQLLALGTGANAIAISALAAPGAGTYWEITRLGIEYKCSGCTAYSGAGHFGFCYDNACAVAGAFSNGDIPTVDAALAGTAPTLWGISNAFDYTATGVVGNNPSGVLNKAVFLVNNASAFTAGTGTLVIDIEYVQHTGA